MMLIELLAAVALSTLLMIALLGVTTTVRRDLAAMPSRGVADQSARGLRALLTHDLKHARGMTIEGDRLVLTGYAALDEQMHEPTHLPARVTYQLLPGAGVLVREQVDQGNLTNREATIEVVAMGVADWVVKGNENGLQMELVWMDTRRQRLEEIFVMGEGVRRAKD